MKNRVILVSLALLLLAAAPVQAKQADCESDPDQNGCSGKGNGNGDVEEFCVRNPDHKKCTRAVVEELCDLVVIHASTPQIGVWDPLLGIVEFNPEDCYDYYIEVDGDREYMHTYDDGAIYYDAEGAQQRRDAEAEAGA